MPAELLTHSKRRAFQNCPRYFYHHNVEHLALRKQKSGRRRGTLFGDALFYIREMHEGGWPDRSGLTLNIEDEIELYLWVKEYLDWRTELFFDSGNYDASEVAEMEVENVKIRVMVCAYIAKYGLDSRREIEYVLPLINPRTKRSSRAYKLGGKIDGCVIFPGKKVDIIEDKFVKQIQRAMIERLALDSQSSEYVDAFMAKGWTARVRYRHTRFPGINPKPPKEYKSKDDYPGETLDEFADRLFEDIEERPEFYLDEQILYFPTEHMEDFRTGRWAIAQQILAARKIKPWEAAYPRNDSRCWEYGGCEFIPLCTKVPDGRDLYIVEDDNPELSVAVETYGGETA